MPKCHKFPRFSLVGLDGRQPTFALSQLTQENLFGIVGRRVQKEKIFVNEQVRAAGNTRRIAKARAHSFRKFAFLNHIEFKPLMTIIRQLPHFFRGGAI